MLKRLTIRMVAACAAAALLASCAGLHYRYATDKTLTAPLAERPASYPPVRFAVISDPHLYDTALGIEGPAFQEYMDSDRKLLPESREILSEALQRVESLSVSFLLIPGDLTKDGEEQDHLLMARQLAALAGKGTKVYVVPGNHDILNPHAVSYSAAGKIRVPNVTPHAFAEIYRDFGYADALYRDPGSLSYVAEPVPGLWLLAVDSANYAENAQKGVPVTGGGLTQGRIDWIESMLAEALRRDKAVISIMHHGVVEHFPGENKYYSEYLVNGWPQVAQMLAAYNVRAVFTGHFHAQDIALRKTDAGKFLYDVETGSLATFPNPVRTVEIGPGQRMRITSSFIKELPSFTAKGIDFWKYSEETLSSGFARIAIKTMNGLGISPREASGIAPQIANAFLAHFRGDESWTGTEMLRSKGLSLMAGIVVGSRKALVNGLWHDVPPADNDLAIDLATGSVIGDLEDDPSAD
jgi:3',5'-cyclic AMP phosphodiesterase CpdA